MKKIEEKKIEEKITNYRNVYCLHLINNNLADDSETISDIDLINYVDNQIDEEDKKWYGLNKY